RGPANPTADVAFRLWGANFSVRREMWAQVGGFDERLPRSQDLEFGLRLADLGLSMMVEPRALSHHLHAVSAAGFRRQCLDEGRCMVRSSRKEWGQRVERLFEADADFWNDVYGGADVFSAVIQRRHATAAGWVDQLSLAPTVPVLEIGCGAGALAVELAQRPMTVCAVDSVHAMVALTRRRAAAAGVQQHLQVDLGDTHALEFADSTFGLVIALGVLPWLHSPARAVYEMARVLKPGGWLIVSADNRDCLVDRLDPARNPLLAPIKRAVKRALKRPDPPAAWVPRGDRRRDTDQMLAGAGFRKIRGLTCGFGPLTLFHRRVVPHRLGAALERGCQRLADRGVPWIRSAGWHYMVLAAREQ